MPASIDETEFEKTADPAELRRHPSPRHKSVAHGAAASARMGSYRAWIVTDSSTFVPPFTTGGTERQLSELARELEQLGADVTVIVRETPNPSSDASTSAEGPRTRYVPPAPVPKGMGWAALVPNVRYIAATFRHLLRARREYDVLIVSGFRQIGLAIALLARIVRKPCLLRVDAAWDLNDELTPESNARIGPRGQRLTSAIIRAARWLTFGLAHRLVAFSDPLERRLVELGAAPRKIEKIPNGVDTELFSPAPPKEKVALRRALGLPTDRVVFIFTGRICPSKGVLELMDVWERLADRSDVYLLLVGTGAHTHESCEDEVREAIARHPDSIGWCGTAVENVSQYLQAADVFIFLSYFESFGLSIVEAVAAGLPCIVTDVGCARQAVRHRENGVVLPPHASPEAVLHEIDWVLAKRDRWPAMGALGRANVVNTFDMQTVARRYIGLFESLGARAHSEPPRAV